MKDASFDEYDRPIWHITGLPLTSYHTCMSVDSTDKSHPAPLKGHFSDVWRSSIAVNNRYHEAKSRYEAYPLAETIERLSNQ